MPAYNRDSRLPPPVNVQETDSMLSVLDHL